MSVERRQEVKMLELNLFDPDTSAEMFYGKYVKSFTHPKAGNPDVSFVYRRIDPGTLLELTDTALYILAKDEQEPEQHEPVEEDALTQLQNAKVRMYHRHEVLHKCIVAPKFKNLDQIKNVPVDWQVELYNLIMHGVLGGDVLTAQRFPAQNHAAGAS